MASTTIGGRGTIDSSSGTGLTVTVPATFTHTPYTTAQSLAASGSATYPGVYTLSNATAAGHFLPNPASYPGGVYTFRSLGTAGQAHFLTGTTSDNLGAFLTQGYIGALRDNQQGSRITLGTAVGSSVTLVSDGLNFCVMANSGTLTFAGS